VREGVEGCGRAWKAVEGRRLWKGVEGCGSADGMLTGLGVLNQSSEGLSMPMSVCTSAFMGIRGRMWKGCRRAWKDV
jgi:hypothetical protein